MKSYFEGKEIEAFTSYRQFSYNFDNHFHNMIELIYCLKGEQGLRVGNESILLKGGDAALVFPNITHEYQKRDHPDSEVISLIAENAFFASLYPQLMTTRPKSAFIPAKQVGENAKDAFSKLPHSKNIPEMLGLGLVAFSDLIQHVELLPVKESDGFSLAPALVAYIDTNFQKPLTIHHLASNFGYSASYVAHIFHDQLKIPFRTYLSSVRSEYAANLIRSTNKSFTEIAYECGYNSLTTFSRSFKKQFQKTPSEFKRQ